MSNPNTPPTTETPQRFTSLKQLLEELGVGSEGIAVADLPAQLTEELTPQLPDFYRQAWC